MNISQKRGLSSQITDRRNALSMCRQRPDHRAKTPTRYASSFGKEAIYKEFTLDNEIPQRYVKLKNPKDGSLSVAQPITKLFNLINRETQVVNLLHNDEAEGVAIVEVVEKEALKARLKKKEENIAAQAKQQRQSKTKQIELNWAISENDLQLKLRQLREFLGKGRKVEVMLASKKRQRKATPEEAENVVKTIRKVISEMDGAREVKPMEGEIGVQAMLTLQQVQKGSPKSAQKQNVDKDAD